ncbi:hypothetical protein DFJ73DRAFT_836391 [Zopfochytrium polystomum]|nr:hypothetical protein DFJ73DRAFT_836391 [Zopfochytrium polystomum]
MATGSVVLVVTVVIGPARAHRASFVGASAVMKRRGPERTRCCWRFSGGCTSGRCRTNGYRSGVGGDLPLCCCRNNGKKYNRICQQCRVAFVQSQARLWTGVLLRRSNSFSLLGNHIRRCKM